MSHRHITEVAWGVIAGDLLLDDVPAGWCLQGVRLVVERAMGWQDFEFYDRFGVARTTQGGDDRSNWSWWAADIEASMKQLHLTVPMTERQPGDLIFSWRLARPYGHVGIALDRGLLLEVVNPDYRPKSMSRKAVCLSSWGSWEPTLAARLPVGG